MVKIGNVEIPIGAGLAPMAGVTDMTMRRLCHELGSAWSVSEMLSAKGYIYSPENRAGQELLERAADEGIVGLQLFGREPDLMAEAAKRLESRGFRFFDVNMGCPAPKIVKNGEGSALMREPEQVRRILTAMVRATSLPVTVKIRAGWDSGSRNAVEIARIAQDAGVQAITVHGRTRTQHYTGHADWHIIAEVKRAVRIPVFGNGDVASGADAQRMLAETGCDAIMVGRGAQGNPWIFAEISAALSNVPYTPPTESEKIAMALRHMDMLVALRGEARAIPEMRKHISWYLSGLRGSARIREQINRLSTASSIRALLGQGLSPCTPCR